VSQDIRVRFAPSPTGHLHLGNVRTALFNWFLARREGGAFVLRLEDTDAARSTQASVDSVLEDLEWLGVDWDEGPGAGGELGPYRQTERYDLYRSYLQRLLDEDKAYPCYCTQEELDRDREAARAAGRTYIYPGTCRHLTPAQRAEKEAEGRRPSIRLKVQPHTVSFTDRVRGHVSIHTHAFGDWILARPDGSPTYNFAVVIDDALMEITHVIRGEDHLSNTPKQIVLYEALGFDPPDFAHLSIILGPDGSKLSKRHGDVSLDAFRKRGFLPEAMINGLALLGWSDESGKEVLDLSEITGAFALDRVNKSAAVFDEPKLRFLNREHIKKLDAADLAEGLRPYLEEAGRLPSGDLDAPTREWLFLLAEMLRDRIDVLSDAPSVSDPVFFFDVDSMDEQARESLEDPDAPRVIAAFIEKTESMDLALPGAYREAVLAIKAETKIKGRKLFHPIRVAITAADSGPDLEKLVPLLAAGSRLSLPAPVLGPAERARRVLSLLK
jgi:glutamyl-tRNA synthetase